MANTQILIVEDDGIIAENIRRKLKCMGYSVSDLVMSGEEAIEKAGEIHPDLILMDIGLSGKIDGVEAARQIHTRFKIPIVYLTAHTDEATLQRAKITEPFGYLTKPFELSELRSVIETALYKHHLEQKLKERETHFRLLYEEAPLAYQSLNIDGCLIEVNQAWLELLGYERDEVMGRWFGDFMAAEESPAFKERFPRFKAAGVICGVEIEMLRKDGTRLDVSIDGRIGYDEEGHFRQTHCILHDITARKQAEETLQQSEEKYRKLFTGMISGSALHEIICDSDGNPVDYITLDVNHVYEAFLEVKREDVIGKRAGEILPQTELQHWLGIFGPVALTGESTHYEMYSASNQKYFKGTVYCPESGKFAVTFSDITQRKQAKEALRKSEEKYRTLFESMRQGVFYQRADGELIDVNPAALEMFGLTRDEFLGRTSHHPQGEVIREDGSQFPAEEHPSMVALKTGRPVNDVVVGVFNPRTQSYTWMIINALPEFQTGETVPYQVAVTLHDITERKQAEHAIAESEALLRITMENISDPVFITDDAGQFTFICPNIPHTLGYSIEEIQEMGNISKLIDDLPPPQALAASGEIQNIERVITDKSGQARQFLLNIKRVSIKNGTVLYTCHEITELKQAEDLRRISEERFKTFFEHQPSYCYMISLEGHILDINQAALDTLGYDRADLISAPLSTIYAPECQARMKDLFAWWQQTGRLVNEEMILITKSGERRTVLLNVVAVRDPSGRLLHSNSMQTDITERKQAQLTLLEQEKTIRALLNATTDSALLLDLEGNLLALNETVANVFGKSVAELIGQCVYNYLPSDVAALRQKKLKETVDSGKPIRFEDERFGRIIDNHIYPVFDDQGQVARAAIFGRDITEHKQAEGIIRLNEERLSALLQLSKMTESSKMEMADFVLKEAVKLTNSRLGFIGFMNEDETVMDIHAWSKEAMAKCEVVDKPLHFPIPDAGLWGEAVRQRQPVIINDYSSAHPHKKGYPAGHVTLTRLLIIPVFDKKQIVVVTAVGNKAEAYDQADIDQLTLLTDGMWKIIQRREAEAALQQRNRQLELLNLAVYAFNSSLALEEVLGAVLEEMRKLLAVTACSAWLVDPATAELVCQQAVGPQNERLRGWRLDPGEGIAGATVTGGQSIIVSDVHTDARYFKGVDRKTGLALRSILSVPLQVKGNIIGVLQAVDTAVNRFTPDDLTLLESLSGSAAIAIENARLFEEISSGRRRLQVLSKRLVETQENERSRIARELHDVIGQALTAVKISLQSAQHSFGAAGTEADVASDLVGMIDIVEQTLQEVRQISFGLRPSLLDDLGLVPALRWYLDRQAQQAGFDTQFRDDSLDPRLPPHLEVACFRIAQEALTNVVRHAQAQHVSIELHQHDTELQLIIHDDGIGFEVSPALEQAATGESLGLLGMQERAQLVGGRLEIESAPHHGTEICLRVPLVTETKRRNKGEELP